MNSTRLSFCVSLGIHLAAFGAVALYGFLHQAPELVGDAEKPSRVLTIIAVPDKSAVSEPKGKPFPAPSPVLIPLPVTASPVLAKADTPVPFLLEPIPEKLPTSTGTPTPNASQSPVSSPLIAARTIA